MVPASFVFRRFYLLPQTLPPPNLLLRREQQFRCGIERFTRPLCVPCLKVKFRQRKLVVGIEGVKADRLPLKLDGTWQFASPRMIPLQRLVQPRGVGVQRKGTLPVRKRVGPAQLFADECTQLPIPFVAAVNEDSLVCIAESLWKVSFLDRRAAAFPQQRRARGNELRAEQPE